MADATPSPDVPYANKQIGTPMLPVFGRNIGGSSVIGSFFKNSKKKKPNRAKAPKIITAYRKYSIKILLLLEF